MNVFSVVGSIVTDMNTKTFDSGSAVSSCRLVYRQGKEDRFISLDFWGSDHSEKTLQYIVKGKKLFVSGELRTREHNSKTYLSVTVNSFQFISDEKKKKELPDNVPVSTNGIEDDIPF